VRGGPAVVDAHGHAFTANDVVDGTAVLVRSDGYVRSVTRNHSEVKRSFNDSDRTPVLNAVVED
jgi:hypothetical protein